MDQLTLAIVLHLVADFIFQNDWMARHKVSVLHKAAYIHAAVHFIAALIVFPWHMALVVAIVHMLIDTRRFTIWWQRIYRQTTEGEYAIHVAIWLDQTLHFLTLAAIVAIMNIA